MSKIYCVECKFLKADKYEYYVDGWPMGSPVSYLCLSPSNVVDTPICQQKQAVSPMCKNCDNDCGWFEPNSQLPPKKPSWWSKLWR